MTDLVTIQSRLIVLEEAISLGALVVTYDGGRRVEYRSLSEMYRIRDDLRNQIAAAGSGSASRRRTVAAYNSGL